MSAKERMLKAIRPESLMVYISGSDRLRFNPSHNMEATHILGVDPPVLSTIVLFKNRSLFPQGSGWFFRKIWMPGKNGDGRYP